MSKFPRFWPALALGCVAGHVITMAEPGAKPKPAVTSPVPPPDQSFAAAGLRVHLDPANGRIAPLPAKASSAPAANVTILSSHEGLVEEPGTSAAGGFKVDARGRFHSAVLLRAGPDGKPVMTCVEGTDAPSPSR